MLAWNALETVFLDMDGTLLDLHFDSHFWLEHVPRRYAEKRGLSFEESFGELMPRYQAMLGTMEWYCVDYWSRELELDIALLKEEVSHLIAVHPHVPEFLARLRRSGKRVTLVTNAHHKSLTLKMGITGLDAHFDAIVCAHDIGVPKENAEFWGRLQGIEPFRPEATVLIDDSLPVLRSARNYGIVYTLAVRNPDSRQPDKDTEEFPAISGFDEIMPA